MFVAVEDVWVGKSTNICVNSPVLTRITFNTKSQQQQQHQQHCQYYELHSRRNVRAYDTVEVFSYLYALQNQLATTANVISGSELNITRGSSSTTRDA